MGYTVTRTFGASYRTVVSEFQDALPEYGFEIVSDASITDDVEELAPLDIRPERCHTFTLFASGYIEQDHAVTDVFPCTLLIAETYEGVKAAFTFSVAIDARTEFNQLIHDLGNYVDRRVTHN